MLIAIFIVISVNQGSVKKCNIDLFFYFFIFLELFLETYKTEWKSFAVAFLNCHFMRIFHVKNLDEEKLAFNAGCFGSLEANRNLLFAHLAALLK